MATKEQPGSYDCYKKAAPDEPLFTLRAKDPIAPYLVEIWVETRKGNFKRAAEIVGLASMNVHVQNRIWDDNHEKLNEALAVADSMRAWHSLNVKPQPVGIGWLWRYR